MSLPNTLQLQYKKHPISSSSYKISFTENGQILKYNSVLDLLQNSDTFRELWMESIAQSGFKAIFWECIPVTQKTIDSVEFESIVIESGMLSKVAPNPKPFQPRFTKDNVTVFPSLGKDALLVVPNPLSDIPNDSYTHIASFTKKAPLQQQHQLWIEVAVRMREVLAQKSTDSPIWLSTSGLGVYWLHVRLDDRPKYYNHQEYKKVIN